jgi:hypothetical protein
MHPRRFNGKMMVMMLAFNTGTRRIRLRRCNALARIRQWMMAAQLGQRLLRPAALAGRDGGSRDALDFLLTKFARRQSKTMAKRPAKMRGIIEAVAIGDFGDRMMRLGRARQFRRGALQAALAQIMRKTAAGTFEQFL